MEYRMIQEGINRLLGDFFLHKGPLLEKAADS